VARASFLVVAAAAALLAAATAAGSPPPGATARCRDGTYSFSHHHSGTCSHHGGVAEWLDGTGGTTTFVRVGHTVMLGARTRTADCRRGPEPDRRCSPGAYYSGLTKAVICSGSFRTGSIRNVPQSEKFENEREYGMKAAHYGHSMEIDHIVSLELGGSNDIANLFPEPGSGAADYHAKDRLENRLHELVCGGGMRLRAVQQSIARDWVGLYRRVFGSAP
jgi:hypothetical protein